MSDPTTTNTAAATKNRTRKPIDRARWFGPAKSNDTRILVPHHDGAELEPPDDSAAFDFMRAWREAEADLLRLNPKNRKARWMALDVVVVTQHLLQQPRDAYGDEPELRQWGHVLARSCTKVALGVLRGSGNRDELAAASENETEFEEAKADQARRRARFLRSARTSKDRHVGRHDKRMAKRVARYERYEQTADALEEARRLGVWKTFPREAESLRRHWDAAIAAAVRIGWLARGRTDMRGRGEGPLLVGPRGVGAAIGFRKDRRGHEHANLRAFFLRPHVAEKSLRRGAKVGCAQSCRGSRPILQAPSPNVPAGDYSATSALPLSLPSEEKSGAALRRGAQDAVVVVEQVPAPPAEARADIPAEEEPASADRIPTIPTMPAPTSDTTPAKVPFADVETSRWVQRGLAALHPPPGATAEAQAPRWPIPLVQHTGATAEERADRRRLLAQLDAAEARNNPG